MVEEVLIERFYGCEDLRHVLGIKIAKENLLRTYSHWKWKLFTITGKSSVTDTKSRLINPLYTSKLPIPISDPNLTALGLS